jgi:ubiquinone/menaquinone biosynthesis C-methylase UbiE
MPCSDDAFPAELARSVATRYGALSSTGESLSCGGALDLAGPRAGETVVDLGCGRGTDVLSAAAAVGPSGAAVGVDASDRMLEVARERAREAAHLQARFVQSDLAQVDLPDGAADVLISNCAINHAPDKAAVYREVYRLLRPGGRFVVSDIVSEGTLPESVRNDPRAWADCYGGAISEGDTLSAISAAGLRDVEVLRRTAPYEKGGVLIRSVTIQGRR